MTGDAPHVVLSLSQPGVISVYFEANVSSNKPQGFNASFWVRRCHQSSDEGEQGSPVCPGGAQCRGGLCQCPQGYGGPHCDRPVCPQDCGITEGRGACNIVRDDNINQFILKRFYLLLFVSCCWKRVSSGAIIVLEFTVLRSDFGNISFYCSSLFSGVWFVVMC